MLAEQLGACPQLRLKSRNYLLQAQRAKLKVLQLLDASHAAKRVSLAQARVGHVTSCNDYVTM